MDNPTFAEAAAISGIPEDALRALAMGPFAVDGERLPLRNLLAIGLIVSLDVHRVLKVEQVTGIAHEVMHGAAPNGGRALVVSLKLAEPVLAWVNVAEMLTAYTAATSGAPVRAPHLVIPTDAMLTDLAEMLAEHRSHAAGVH
jgi:hypothetical protein